MHAMMPREIIFKPMPAWPGIMWRATLQYAFVAAQSGNIKDGVRASG
jgi:hypothetical protein